MSKLEERLKNYRLRAEELRKMAINMHDGHRKAVAQCIEANYRRMADLIEKSAQPSGERRPH